MGRPSRFSSNTVRTVGALLPGDVLAKINSGEGLDGLGPDAYGLDADTRMRDVINNGWNAAKAHWWRFQKELRSLPETEAATSLTRDRWIMPLLSLLGFDEITTNPTSIDIAGTSYPISHTFHQSPLHLMGARVELDGRSANTPGAARLSPHSLTQQFLNRSDDHLWGIVCNGRHLRLLRDSVSLTRQAYIEFDLEAMFNGEVFPDFNLLYRTLHSTRFEGTRPADCLLENWIAAAREDGIAARDQLRDGVEHALTTLGTGFLCHPNNAALRAAIDNGKLTDKDLYRHLLRLVYRLLFLFVAEDRDLLHSPDTTPATRNLYTRFYSTQRLRTLASQPTSTQHDDLWAGLTALMGILGKDKGEPALGLPGLGSFLWQPDAVGPLKTADLNNTQLLEALHHLAFLNDNGSVRRIDFGSLGAEELGSVYESLLELHPETADDCLTFTLRSNKDHERRGTGSYYTPQSLVKHLLDWTLDPAIQAALGTQDPETSILALKVVDPTCGSGHFLVAAAHRLGAALASVRSGESHSPNDIQEVAVRDVIANCLYGVDINPMAVELCKISLWIDSLNRGMPLSFLDHRIRVGNSLLGVTPRLLSSGIPAAAYAPQADDDKAAALSWKKRNASVLAGQSTIPFTPSAKASSTHDLWDALNQMPESTIGEVVRKKAAADDARSSNSERRYTADSWCAAFLVSKTEEASPILSDNEPSSPSSQASRQVAVASTIHSPFHWHLEFPDVFQGDDENQSTGWNGGFDVVLGNPPFLNQLETATVQSKKLSALSKCRFPGIAKGYADTATVFLELSSQIANPNSGRIGLVQPDSILSAADAKAARQSVTTRGVLEVLWVAGEKVFTANVLTCTPVIRNGGEQPETILRRFKGKAFEELPSLAVGTAEVQTMETWAPLISEGFGIPRVEIDTLRTMGDVLTATADFRDQYYGLIPFTKEADDLEPSRDNFAALVTTGLIDPALLLWGKRTTKFNKTTYQAPIVDLDRLRAESDLGPWADRRLVPKLLLATQTKVLEVVVDEEGALLPSVPVITVTTNSIGLTHAAAALMSPPITAWAAAKYMGSALSTGALKLSASQVESLPLPAPSPNWDRAARSISSASLSNSQEEWQASLLEAARSMCDAYEVSNGDELMAWWLDRLPAWRGGDKLP